MRRAERWTVGLDFGQGADYSAAVVVETVAVLPAGVSREAFVLSPADFVAGIVQESHVRALRRWPLGTGYPAIVSDVAAMMRRPPLDDGLLVFDRSGVGRAVGDLLFQTRRLVRFACAPAVGIITTGGVERNGWNIPKRDLFTELQLQLQQNRLRVAEGLQLGPVLERELLGFRQKLTDSGRETFDIQRRDGEGHGDLVSALMLALIQPNEMRRPRVVEHPDTITRKATS
ncbi:hypothetical protein [Microbacterium sp. KR10-403]|uniref:hypothetical protein n=1 Tax=Microbacterium sp. KR10-403 TaxID=3158581 RepID=UPI0032E3B8BF